MDVSNYAIEIFKSHLNKSNINCLNNKVILEIGPGDSIATAIIAHSYGARSVLLDVDSFAKVNINTYKTLIENLKRWERYLLILIIMIPYKIS